jgi:hypothetical protein
MKALSPLLTSDDEESKDSALGRSGSTLPILSNPRSEAQQDHADNPTSAETFNIRPIASIGNSFSGIRGRSWGLAAIRKI